MPSTDWAPAVAAVGARLRSRTKDRDGNELGTFTDTTRPTGDEVERLIAEEAGNVADVVGDDLDIKFWERAAAVTVLGTAAAVELTYFPEQVATGRSPYDQLKTLYTERLGNLKTAVEAGGGDTPGEGDATALPQGYFPDVPLVDWRTQL